MSLHLCYCGLHNVSMNAWYVVCRRQDWEPKQHSRVCSWHFPEGREKPPSLFEWNIKKQFNFPDAEKRKRRYMHVPIMYSGLGIVIIITIIIRHQLVGCSRPNCCDFQLSTSYLLCIQCRTKQNKQFN